MRHVSMDFGLIVLFLALAGDRVPAGCQPQQGIAGKIVFVSGNQMPSPGVQRDPGRGVRREVLIYPLMNKSRLEDLEGGFYAVPDQEPLKTVSSGNDGTFSVRLDPGRYSLFVKEDGKLYANLSDGEGNIHPVEVEAGKVTEVEFKITHAAYY